MRGVTESDTTERLTHPPTHTHQQLTAVIMTNYLNNCHTGKIQEELQRTEFKSFFFNDTSQNKEKVNAFY